MIGREAPSKSTVLNLILMGPVVYRRILQRENKRDAVISGSPIFTPDRTRPRKPPASWERAKGWGQKPQVCRTYWYSAVFGIRSQPIEPRPSGCARKDSADVMLTLCGGCAFLKWRSYGAERFLIVRVLAGENDSFVVCLGIIMREAARWPKKALPP
jgi:hypothetical protein